MKKVFCILMTVLFLTCGLSACTVGGTEIPPTGLPEDTQTPPVSDTDTANNENLVVYFSCTNTTKTVAEKIAKVSGAALYRIVPEVPYTSADLNYNNNDSRANKEQNDPTSRPAMSDGLKNISQYKTVFIGYPIWWGGLPKIIYTFTDAYDLSGKTVVPFCTSGSSGIIPSVNEIKQEEPNADVLDGRRFSSGVSETDIAVWIDGLNLKTETEKDGMQLYITVGETRLVAALEENSGTAALKEKLKAEPLVIRMSDYGGFEKVGDFGFDLPTSNEQITAQPCDFVLYQGNRLVIFYGSNSWSYTRLGKIIGITASELKIVLGNGDVTVTLSLS